MQDLPIGTQILHNEHGPCEVTFSGSDYIGIRTRDGQNALVRKDSHDLSPWSEESEAAWRADIAAQEAEKLAEAKKPWPESTFIFEPEGTEHFMGSHWDPFYEQGVREILNRLPKLIAEGVVAEGFGDLKNPPRPLPGSWIKGCHLAWPKSGAGLIMNIAIDEAKKENYFCAVFPFWPGGMNHRLTMLEVSVWENGVEAQITAGLGEAEITFYDAHYLLNRGWYERGREYDFFLTGIAYTAGPAEHVEMPISRHPDQIAWEAMLAQQRGEEPREMPNTITLDGAALLMPVSGWDADEYSFRGPVKYVQPFSNFLGESGWLARVTVIRPPDYSTEDVDLDVVITSRAWQGASAPEIGQELEGGLWLQGHLEGAG